MNQTPTAPAGGKTLKYLLTGLASLAVVAAGSAVVLIEPQPAAPAAAPAPVAAEVKKPSAVYVSLTAPSPDFTRQGVTSTPGEETQMEMAVASGAPHDDTLRHPLPGSRLTSPYGNRTSPVDGRVEFHNGTDFAAACGTGLQASAGGTIIAAGVHNGTGGNRVEIRHSSGLITTYSHMQDIGVRPGQSVERGQIVGSVGSTGASTGCHLHYEVWKDGATVNPEDWL